MHWLWVEYTGTVRERASELSCLVFISCYANRLLFLLFFLVDTLPDVVGPCVCVCVTVLSFISLFNRLLFILHWYFVSCLLSSLAKQLQWHYAFALRYGVVCVWFFFIILLSIFISYSHIPIDCFSLMPFFCWFTLHRAQCRVQIYKQTQTNIHIAVFFVSAQTFPCALNRFSDGNFENSKPITRFLR